MNEIMAINVIHKLNFHVYCTIESSDDSIEWKIYPLIGFGVKSLDLNPSLVVQT